MEWTCPHCNILFNFKNHQQKGGHLTNCASNPKRSEIIAKNAQSRIVPRIEIISDCKKCGKTFSQFKTEREIETQKDIAIFCSKSCANSHIISDEQRLKTSNTLKNKYESGEIINPNIIDKEKRNCSICNNVFECLPSSKQQTCSSECCNKLISKKLKGTGKVGGYKVKSGTAKFHGGYYKDIWMDSSWEIALATRLDELDINWERNSKRFFNYIDIDGNQRKYYPDFYLPDYDLYLECKGYWTDKVKHKMQDVQIRNNFKLIILDKLDKIKTFNI